MTDNEKITALLDKVLQNLSTTDKWEETIKSLLELGKLLSEIKPGIKIDGVPSVLEQNEVKKPSLDKQKSIRLSAIYEEINLKCRSCVAEDVNIDFPVFQYFLLPVKIATTAFDSNIGNSEDAIAAIDSCLNDGNLTRCIEQFTARAQKLNAAKQGIDELTDYSNSHFSDSGIDQLAGKKKESVSHIATSFRSKAYDYVGGDNEAFKSFNTTNVEPIKILSENRQAKNIIASIMLSLTGIGLVVGIAQYCYSGNFLFCETKSHSIVEDNIRDQFPKV